MFDQLMADVAAERTLSGRLSACARLENAACAARLSLMADMLAAAHAADGSAEREQWRLDNWGAVCAQIGAAHVVTSGVASGLLIDAVTLRERLPKVGAVFAAGRIGYKLVHLICSRTMLVKDLDALRVLDAELAALVATSEAMSREQAEQSVDALVLRHDPYAVRRTQTASRGCHVDVRVEDGSGVAYVDAKVLVTDGEAIDQRLDALARTVCEHDPRTVDQRRAAAFGAVGFGWDRLPCLCGHDDCAAASTPAGGGVVIHVIADTDALGGTNDVTDPSSPPTPSDPAAPPVGDLTTQRRALVGEQSLLPKPWYTYDWSGLLKALDADPGEFCPARPGVILGGGLVPAAIVAQVALHATITQLRHPGNAPPEPRYRPSRALAQFIRCRDQTCRYPGCTRRATVADIDHTVAHPFGPTAASNLACLCRAHHLLKTFWPGWRSRQSPDGTVTWTDPDDETHTTRPGSRLLFPELCKPTGQLNAAAAPSKHTAGLTMPRRATTRAQDRTRRIDDERRRNALEAGYQLLGE